MNFTAIDFETASSNIPCEIGLCVVREGKINVSPGYDGIYGVVKVFSDKQKIKPEQKALF